MFKLFARDAGEAEAAEANWPVASIVGTLQSHYPASELLGEDGPLRVYGVQDNGVNFVVALMQSAPGSGKVIEIGFLARFVGFDITLRGIESLNANLHISVASMEGNDLFLMAGLQITGPYDAGQFSLLLNAWRRDLAMALHSLSGDSASLAEAFPAAKLAVARDFAVNAAPVPAPGEEGETAIPGAGEMLSRFLAGRAETQEISEENDDSDDSSGRRGLIARLFPGSDGAGFVAPKKNRR